MTRSLNPIVVTVLWVGFSEDSLGAATGRHNYNCPVPETGDNRDIRSKVIYIREDLSVKTFCRGMAMLAPNWNFLTWSGLEALASSQFFMNMV